MFFLQTEVVEENYSNKHDNNSVLQCDTIDLRHIMKQVKMCICDFVSLFLWTLNAYTIPKRRFFEKIPCDIVCNDSLLLK